MSTKNSTSSNDTGSKLLFLPQLDLKRSTRPDLVLMALPNKDVQKALMDGNCKLLTNSKSSSLVLPTTSYNLTTIGTSNTLVVYPKATTTALTEKEEEEDRISNKRIKLLTDENSGIQSCRLIQPGGSGASFLSLEKMKLSLDAIRSFLLLEKKYCSLSDLCLEFQCSAVEMKQALEKLPCTLIPKEQQYQQGDEEGRRDDDEEYRVVVELLTEEQVLQAQRALLQALCEEQEGEEDNLSLDVLVPLVAKRIDEYQQGNGNDGVGDDIDEKQPKFSHDIWSRAVGEKIIKLASSSSSSGSATTSITLDKEKVAAWALQDLVMNRSTWELRDLLDTWSLRLPTKWCSGEEQEEGDHPIMSRSFLKKIAQVEITKSGDKNNPTETVTFLHK